MKGDFFIECTKFLLMTVVPYYGPGVFFHYSVTPAKSTIVVPHWNHVGNRKCDFFHSRFPDTSIFTVFTVRERQPR